MNLDEFTVHREGDTFYVDNDEIVFQVKVTRFMDQGPHESRLKSDVGLTKDEAELILRKVDQYIIDNREPSEDERMDNFIERRDIENLYG